MTTLVGMSDDTWKLPLAKLIADEEKRQADVAAYWAEIAEKPTPRRSGLRRRAWCWLASAHNPGENTSCRCGAVVSYKFVDKPNDGVTR